MDDLNHSTLEEKLISQIRNLGIQYEWIPVNPDYADTAQFCKKYGFSVDQSGNTIIVASKRGPKIYCACLVLATDRLDVNKKVKSLMNVSRVSFANPDETTKLTGMMIGGVTIFGLPEDIPIYVDAKVLDAPKIILGGGSRSGKIIISPQDIVKIPKVQITEGLSISISQ